MIDLSLILPVHNEADIIGVVLANILVQLKKSHISYECLLVENGSRDDSLSVIQNLAKQYKNIRVLTAPQGYGSAVIAGLSKAKGEYVCYMPSDGQIDLSVLPALWSKRKLYDLVKVKRITRESLLRMVVSKTFSVVMTVLFGLPLWDINGSPRLCARKNISALRLSSKDSFIDAQMAMHMKKIGWSVCEVPMKTLDRAGGESSRSWRTFAEFFGNIWKAFITSFYKG
jgi:polyisoprenyl-phosphate glycosyltransferase